jgi:hypothetical protein
MGSSIDWIRTRLHLILPLLLCVAVLVTSISYWGAASRISGSCEYWSNGCGGDYLPWPRDGSGLICTMEMVSMDSIDRFFCLLVVIKMYIPLVIVQIVATAWIGRLIARRIFTPILQDKPEEKSP